MPSRIIREAGLTSKKLAAVSDFGERLYWRIYQAVDDFGRFHAHPDIIRARCFPVMLEKVTVRTVRAGRDELARVGLLLLYGSDMGEVLQITKFEQRVRAQESKFPAPDDRQMTVIRPADDGLGSGTRNYGTGNTEQRALPAPDNGAARASTFERFWTAYPKKRSKGDALKAWSALKPTAGMVDRILAALSRLTACHDWVKDGGKWIPYPATWLRAMGWEDDPGSVRTGPDELEGL